MFGRKFASSLEQLSVLAWGKRRAKIATMSVFIVIEEAG